LSKRVVVIGGGFGGLAAALRCRKLGFDVTLLERLNMLGGRARVFEKDGYRHDAGPTVITAPFLFEELFELFGENLKDYLKPNLFQFMGEMRKYILFPKGLSLLIFIMTNLKEKMLLKLDQELKQKT